MSRPTLEFWFEFASNYSYLSVMRIEELSARHDVAIAWRPFLLGPIFRSFGWDTSPFVLQKAKGQYVWKDMARQCDKYRLPWRKPTVFPRRSLLPMRVAMVGADQHWIGEFCREVMLLNFWADEEIDDETVVRAILKGLGLPADTLVAEACSEANKARLREQTETARARGIFGAPTFFAGTEMYWGNDRLEDAIAACLAHAAIA